MNNLIAFVVGTLIVLLLGWQWTMVRRAKRSEGLPAPETAAVDGGVDAARRIYYFHAVRCGPCRAITPLVERLREEFPNLISLDVAEHLELARRFSIAATPSFIVVADGIVQEVKLGAVTEAWLRARLTDG